MRYAVVIERAEGNYSAYVPDLPGCMATGTPVAEVEAEIREAIVFGENIQLTRRIWARLGESRLFIDDLVENMG